MMFLWNFLEMSGSYKGVYTEAMGHAIWRLQALYCHSSVINFVLSPGHVRRTRLWLHSIAVQRAANSHGDSKGGGITRTLQFWQIQID